MTIKTNENLLTMKFTHVQAQKWAEQKCSAGYAVTIGQSAPGGPGIDSIQVEDWTWVHAERMVCEECATRHAEGEMCDEGTMAYQFTRDGRELAVKDSLTVAPPWKTSRDSQRK